MHKSRFCSRRCKDHFRRAIEKTQRLASKETRHCVFCNEILPKESRIDKKFCSDECQRNARFNTSRAERRMRIPVGGTERSVSRLAIYKRDNWTCLLCGEPVDRDRSHPDPMCASLDHVVPVSMGGTNAAENLQTSHLVCNLRAGNKKQTAELRPAPEWDGIEYCSASDVVRHLGLPKTRVMRLLETGHIPSLERETERSWWRIPVSFIDEIQATGIPESFLVDRRVKPDRKAPPTHRELSCAHCGEVVTVPIGLLSRRKFCSEACVKESRKIRKRVTAPKEPSGKFSKSCVVCGKPNPITNGAHRSIICRATDCKKEYRYLMRAKTLEATRPIPGCVYCGKPVALRQRGGGRQRRLCSDVCRKELARRRASDHYRNNGVNYNAQLREERLKAKMAAPNKCLACGAVFPPASRSDKKYCSSSCRANKSQLLA
jgi:predicted nucleic acid-binding Zn ribbon protein